jgi:hypothetical protein
VHSPDKPTQRPDPDHAWKALSLVNDWIRHADTKVGVTLAATGVTAITLANVLRGTTSPSPWLLACAILSGLLLLVAGSCGVAALVPRRKIGKRTTPEAHTNLLFYKHIGKAYEGRSARYAEALARLTMNEHELTAHLAHQIHANSAVADRKFTWADRAIKALAGAILVVALTAVLRGTAEGPPQVEPQPETPRSQSS